MIGFVLCRASQAQTHQQNFCCHLIGELRHAVNLSSPRNLDCLQSRLGLDELFAEHQIHDPLRPERLAPAQAE